MTTLERVRALQSEIRTLMDSPCTCGHALRQHWLQDGSCLGVYVPGEKKNRACRCRQFVEPALSLISGDSRDAED